MTKETTPPVNSLMLMMTYACQFACDYCEVRRDPRSMSLPVIKQAIDLLLTTSAQQCQLRFWGGEPLLKWENVRRAVTYAEQRARKAKKAMKFMITTNGYLLDKDKLRYLKQHDFEIMFSLDGDKKVHDRHRRLKNGGGTFKKLSKNLQLLDSAKIPYFVNLVATGTTANSLHDTLASLKRRGIPRVQVCYQCGVVWKQKDADVLLRQIDTFIAKNKPDGFLMNFHNSCEPTMLSQEILVDTDGEAYYDAAIFLEKTFPSLRKNYHLGNIATLKSIDPLYAHKTELFRKFTEACSLTEQKALQNNISLGLSLGNFFKERNKNLELSNEHPVIGSYPQRNFLKQKQLLGKLGLNACYLRIDGPCANDCIFCKQKTGIPFTETLSIKKRLCVGTGGKTGKICLIGNEPLLHPDIAKIVKMAKKNGFREIEIMTSGALLADADFTRDIIAAGAVSFSLPLFSDQAPIHDRITGQKGSFAKTLRGIENARAYGARIFVHTNLVRQNIDSCLELEKFVRHRLNLPFAILPIRPKTSNLPFSQLMPAYSEMTERLKGVESLAGFPLCVTGKIQKPPFKNQTEMSDSMKLYFLDQNFIKLKRCFSCLLLDQCAGIFREYAQCLPLDEIAPFKTTDENTLY